jgi:hypothetical protein
MDKKSKNFIAKLMEELEKTQATLAKQEKLYVTCKKALASERSEVETLRLEVDQAESVIVTFGANHAPILVPSAQTVHQSCAQTNTISKRTETSFHLWRKLCTILR